MSTSITPDDICLLVKHLQKQGIAPLVWGEAACVAAYHSRLVPERLFFIVKDSLFEETKQTLEKLDLERKYDFNPYEVISLPLSRPYVRYALLGDGLSVSQPYLQIFKASDVGLEGTEAWESAVAFRGRFLVPNYLHYLLVAATLYTKVIETRDEYLPWQCSGALNWIEYLLSEALAPESKDRQLPNNFPATRATEMAWVLHKPLPRKAADIKKRLGFDTRRKQGQTSTQNIWIHGEV